MQRVEYLDWLRALAISLVVIGHVARAAAPGGAVGVSVFFVLSGYLITSILLGDGILTPGNIGRFIVRRLGRIYPLYVLQIVALTAAFWLVTSRHLDSLLAELPMLLTFTGGYADFPGYGFAVLWTLRAEFWFYVTFPLLLWAALASGRPLFVLAVLGGCSLVAKGAGVAVPILLYYDHFLIGAAVCVAIKFDASPKMLARREASYVGLALVLVAATVPYPGSWSLAWYVQSLVAAIGTGLIILAFAVNAPTRSMPAVAFLGRISYSVYLLHALVLDAAHSIASNLPIYLATVVLLSTATYFLIERPFIRLVHRYVRFRPSRQLADV